MQSRLASTVTTVLLNAASVAAVLLLAEVGYRFVLVRTMPQHFTVAPVANEHPNVWYFQDSPWRFDARFGYTYPPGTYQGGSIAGGRVQRCWSWTTNPQGNIGRTTDYKGADLKVVVMGDSWTAQQREWTPGDRVTWPNFLEEDLRAATGRKVSVMNLGRDGAGLLHMFDLAAVKAPELKPHLVIFAYITDDLTRARFWRTTTRVRGAPRIMTTIEPNPNPDWRTATDTAILDPKATRDWCEGMIARPNPDDPVLKELEARVLESRQHSSLRADPYTLDQSFLYDRLVHRNPLYTTFAAARPSQNPRHGMADFAEDPGVRKAVEVLKASRVPVLFVHLAIYGEFKDNKEYVTDDQGLALNASLGRLFDRPVYGTLDYTESPVPNPERLSGDYPHDHHPSIEGMRFYAAVVTKILEKNGLIAPRQP